VIDGIHPNRVKTGPDVFEIVRYETDKYSKVMKRRKKQWVVFPAKGPGHYVFVVRDHSFWPNHLGPYDQLVQDSQEAKQEVVAQKPALGNVSSSEDMDRKVPAVVTVNSGGTHDDLTVAAKTSSGTVKHPYLSVYGEEERQQIIDLMADDDDLPPTTKTIDQTVDGGDPVAMTSEVDYWTFMFDKAKQKNEAALQLLEAKKKDRAKQEICTIGFILPLPAAEKLVIEDALYKEGDASAVVQRADNSMIGANPYLTREDIQTLRPRVFLNESVIDYYMHCLRVRQNKCLEEKKPCKVCYFYRTAFYTKINPEDLGLAEPYEYKQVMSWTKKNVPGNSIFECNALFFPCKIGHKHWILIVAFMQEKKYTTHC
jgi:hypothetical protein